ncbi:MAG: NDP-sugar synthase, partial [Balneolaceae bacterium]|nr:NDP-sugar synthase [Balneolaceae bacterium]
YEGDKITDFVEKPSEPISNLAIIGVYYFREAADIKKEIEYLLENDIRGHGDEFQLTDALDRMLKDDKIFKKATVDEWLDCGTLPAWRETSRVILEKEQHPYDEQEYSNTRIVPPVYIGENVTLEGCTIGPNASIARGCRITNTTVSNSIIRSHTAIEESTIENCTIGRHVEIKNVSKEVHLGDHSKIGVGV